ncbi:MAG: hypothetical protein AAB506_00235, partial [Patescibacteria group bacterium]
IMPLTYGWGSFFGQIDAKFYQGRLKNSFFHFPDLSSQMAISINHNHLFSIFDKQLVNLSLNFNRNGSAGSFFI